jgi:hypothetical protein
MAQQLCTYNFKAAKKIRGQSVGDLKELFFRSCVDSGQLEVNGVQPSLPSLIEKIDILFDQRNDAWVSASEHNEFRDYELHNNGVDWCAVQHDWIAGKFTVADNSRLAMHITGKDNWNIDLDMAILAEKAATFKKDSNDKQKRLYMARQAQNAALLQHQSVQTHEKTGTGGTKRKNTHTHIGLDGSETEQLKRAMRMKAEAIALATPEKVKIETMRLELEHRRLDMQKEQTEKTVSLFEDQREQTKNLMAQQQQQMAQQQQQMAATTAMLVSMGSILTKLAEKLDN